MEVMKRREKARAEEMAVAQALMQFAGIEKVDSVLSDERGDGNDQPGCSSERYSIPQDAWSELPAEAKSALKKAGKSRRRCEKRKADRMEAAAAKALRMPLRAVPLPPPPPTRPASDQPRPAFPGATSKAAGAAPLVHPPPCKERDEHKEHNEHKEFKESAAPPPAPPHPASEVCSSNEGSHSSYSHSSEYSYEESEEEKEKEPEKVRKEVKEHREQRENCEIRDHKEVRDRKEVRDHKE
eukprot:4285457-Lingulodinium_polyedra.AAC.1